MTAVAPTPVVPSGEQVAAHRLTLWSWIMLPVFLLGWTLSAVLNTVFLHLLDLQEGDLLLSAGGAGAWAGEVAVTLVALAVPVAGITLATAAARRHPTWATWLALALNAVLVVLVLYGFADDIRMAY